MNSSRGPIAKVNPRLALGGIGSRSSLTHKSDSFERCPLLGTPQRAFPTVPFPSSPVADGKSPTTPAEYPLHTRPGSTKVFSSEKESLSIREPGCPPLAKLCPCGSVIPSRFRISNEASRSVKRVHNPRPNRYQEVRSGHWSFDRMVRGSPMGLAVTAFQVAHLGDSPSCCLEVLYGRKTSQADAAAVRYA